MLSTSLGVSPKAKVPGRRCPWLHLVEGAEESVSTPFPWFEQWLNLFFGCLALFESCDGEGGRMSASVWCDPGYIVCFKVF
jgi:hypothetical protein